MKKDDIINRIKNNESLRFVNEIFENMDLSRLNLHHAKFINCKFLNVKFKYTNLQCVDFINLSIYILHSATYQLLNLKAAIWSLLHSKWQILNIVQ